MSSGKRQQDFKELVERSSFGSPDVSDGGELSFVELPELSDLDVCELLQRVAVGTALVIETRAAPRTDPSGRC